MPAKHWKILLADDHHVAREGVKATLRAMKETANARVEEVGNGDGVMQALQTDEYDLLIVDVFLEGADGLQALDYIRQRNLNIPSIVFSRFDNQRVRKAALMRGAKAFIFKSQPVAYLEKAVRAVLNGKKYSSPSKRQEEKTESFSPFSTPLQERCSLTRREIQVLQLVASSKSNKEIASQLFISEQTVGVHRKNLMRKLGARNKTGLVRAAYELNFIE
jgi:DNA-binding NarL/FixJ family response regulator